MIWGAAMNDDLTRFESVIRSIRDEYELVSCKNMENVYWLPNTDVPENPLQSVKDSIQHAIDVQTLWLDCTSKDDNRFSEDYICQRLRNISSDYSYNPSMLEHGESERIMATSLRDGLAINTLKDIIMTFSEQRMPLVIFLKAFREGKQGYNIHADIQRFIDQTSETPITWFVKIVRKTPVRSGAKKQDTVSRPPTKKQIEKSIKARRGQQEFRARLLGQFQGQCCITGCSAEEVLEAAHISPYSMNQDMGLSNGLILRADLHTLFDCGLLAIDTERKQVLLAPRLQKSVDYGALKGHQVFLPDEPADDAAKRKAALDRHREERKREW
jgi:hypothetical protein